MEYFIMKTDDRIKNPLKLNLKPQDFNITEPSVLYSDYDNKTHFADYFYIKYIFNYAFFALDELKELLEIYADDLEAVPIFITDDKKTQQKVYWKIELKNVDCVFNEPFIRYDQLTLIKEKIKTPYIFKVTFEKQQYIVVSLHLAENILRRNLYGIQFVPVKLK